MIVIILFMIKNKNFMIYLFVVICEDEVFVSFFFWVILKKNIGVSKNLVVCIMNVVLLKYEDWRNK